jgi:hypothetical protein
MKVFRMDFPAMFKKPEGTDDNLAILMGFSLRPEDDHDTISPSVPELQNSRLVFFFLSHGNTRYFGGKHMSTPWKIHRFFEYLNSLRI